LFTRCITAYNAATLRQLNNKECKGAWEAEQWPQYAVRGCFVSVTVSGHSSTI